MYKFEIDTSLKEDLSIDSDFKLPQFSRVVLHVGENIFQLVSRVPRDNFLPERAWVYCVRGGAVVFGVLGNERA